MTVMPNALPARSTFKDLVRLGGVRFLNDGNTNERGRGYNVFYWEADNWKEPNEGCKNDRLVSADLQ